MKSKTVIKIHEAVKDDLQAALDLVEPSGVRMPGEGNKEMHDRIIDAYIEKYPGFAWDTLNHLVGSPEFIVALYHKFGPLQYEDFFGSPIIPSVMP